MAWTASYVGNFKKKKSIVIIERKVVFLDDKPRYIFKSHDIFNISLNLQTAVAGHMTLIGIFIYTSALNR